MTKKIERANTSYNDLRGTVAVDFPGTLGISEFENYIESIGIDLSKYDPQGFEIYGGEGFDIDDITISIFAIDKEKKDEYQRENNGRLPIVKIRHADTFLNLLNHIHRLNIICMEGYRGDSNDLSNLDIIEDISVQKEKEEEE